MTRPLWVSLATAVALVGAACGGDATSDPSVVRADSAGVRIITSTGPDKPLAWRFDTLDVLRDSLGEPWLFTAVDKRRVLTDRAGRTYVLENEPAIRRFGRDGRYERSIGRKGGAPGEMQFPTALRQQGDTLVVFDANRDVLVRWDPEFAAINDLRLTGALSQAVNLAFRFGGMWVEKQEYSNQQLTSSLFLDTTSVEPAFQVQSAIPRMVRSSCGGGSSVAVALPPFFSPEIHWDVASARILVSSGAGYDLHLAEGSRPIARIRRDLPTRAPTADDVRLMYPNGFKVGLPGQAACEFDFDQLLQEAGFAPQMPFVHGVVLLSDGTMWVQRSVRNELPSRVDVFGTDGAYVGTLTGFRLPVGRLPNGEVLFPIDDEESGGLVIARIQIVQ